MATSAEILPCRFQVAHVLSVSGGKIVWDVISQALCSRVNMGLSLHEPSKIVGVHQTYGQGQTPEFWLSGCFPSALAPFLSPETKWQKRFGGKAQVHVTGEQPLTALRHQGPGSVSGVPCENLPFACLFCFPPFFLHHVFCFSGISRFFFSPLFFFPGTKANRKQIMA